MVSSFLTVFRAACFLLVMLIGAIPGEEGYHQAFDATGIGSCMKAIPGEEGYHQAFAATGIGSCIKVAGLEVHGQDVIAGVDRVGNLAIMRSYPFIDEGDASVNVSVRVRLASDPRGLWQVSGSEGSSCEAIVVLRLNGEIVSRCWKLQRNRDTVSESDWEDRCSERVRAEGVLGVKMPGVWGEDECTVHAVILAEGHHVLDVAMLGGDGKEAEILRTLKVTAKRAQNVSHYTQTQREDPCSQERPSDSAAKMQVGPDVVEEGCDASPCFGLLNRASQRWKERRVLWGPGGGEGVLTEPQSTTFVVAALDAKRPSHYLQGDSTFKGDYLYSLEQVLKLRVPTVVYLMEQHVSEIAAYMHARVQIRLVPFLEEEFRHSALWRCVQDRCANAKNQNDTCANDAPLSDWQVRLSQIWLNKPYWMDEVALANPFTTDTLLWLDVGRCPHLLATPLDLSFLHNAAQNQKFVIFAAKDETTPCFGRLSRERRTALRNGSEPTEILRAQLMGGRLETVRKVAELYDDALLNALHSGEVYDKEEPLITMLWDGHPDLFHTIPTYHNVLGQNMEIVTCWSIHHMSAHFPSLAIVSPPDGGALGFEDDFLIIDPRNLHVLGGGAVMQMKGEHAYSTRLHQEVEVCYKIISEGPSGRIKEDPDVDQNILTQTMQVEVCYKIFSEGSSGRIKEDPDVVHGQRMRVIPGNVGLFCLDASPIARMPRSHELDSGSYQVFAYVSRKMSADPVTASVNASFTISAWQPPAHIEHPHDVQALESKWDLLHHLAQMLTRQEGESRQTGIADALVRDKRGVAEEELHTWEEDVGDGVHEGLGGRGVGVLVGCLAQESVSDLLSALRAASGRVVLCSSCASLCGGTGAQSNTSDTCTRTEKADLEFCSGSESVVFVLIHAHGLTRASVQGVLEKWAARLEKGGMIAGSHYFSRSLLSSSIIAVSEGGRDDLLLDAWRHVVLEKLYLGASGLSELGDIVDEHGGAGLVGVKENVDVMVTRKGGYLGVTIEPHSRWWYAKLPTST